MIDEQKLRERAEDMISLGKNGLLELEDMKDAPSAILALLDELATLRSERTAWRVTAENAEAQVESDRVSRGVPAGMVLVPKSLIDAFPEINPSNYDHDDACELNRCGCEVVTTAIAASPQPQPVQAQPSEAFLLRDLSDEIGVEVPRLSSTIASLGHGNYSTNMEVPEAAANAARFYFGVAQPKPANQPTEGLNMLTDEHIASEDGRCLTAHAQFIGAGDVWIEGVNDFARAIEAAVEAPLLERIAALTAQIEQASLPVASANEVQWRNIKKVVRAIADLNFGSKDEPGWLGTAWLCVVTSLTAKDGLGSIELEPLYTAPPKAVPLTEAQIEAAAKALAYCADYPWEHMPEAGRLNMRKNARTVIEAAIGTPATVEKGET